MLVTSLSRTKINNQNRQTSGFQFKFVRRFRCALLPRSGTRTNKKGSVYDSCNMSRKRLHTRPDVGGSICCRRVSHIRHVDTHRKKCHLVSFLLRFSPLSIFYHLSAEMCFCDVYRQQTSSERCAWWWGRKKLENLAEVKGHETLRRKLLEVFEGSFGFGLMGF